MKPKYKDEEWLRDQYLEKEKSMKEISENVDCSDGTIYRNLRKFGIETRDHGEGGYHIDLTPFGQQFLDGLMLGDGRLEGYPKSACYHHKDSYREYIQWLSERLTEIGLENETGDVKPSEYNAWTKHYRELKPQYDEWYPTGHKKTHIPKRVEVTPVVLFNWFIGDGTYQQDKDGYWHLRIASTTFGKDLSRMVQQMKDLGIPCAKVTGGINFHQPHEVFFEYILSSGIEIPPKYKYKFPDNRIKPK